MLGVEQAAHSDTKSALTTREELVAIVSHDLRNPVGAILSSMDVLLDDPAVRALGSDTKKWLDVIKRNAETSLRLISDILDMERIVDGPIQLQIAPCAMDALIGEIQESFAHLASAKRLRLETAGTSLDQPVDCDKDRIVQVLSNLVGNAIKFTPEGGRVTITTEVSASEIKVSVKDTGPGIPSEQQGRIFEKFVQIGNKSRAGLGLGLYISKTLIKSHGGKLWVDSRPGEGSDFSFTLPR